MGSRTYEKALTLRGGIDDKMPTWVITNRQLVVPAGADVTFYKGDLGQLIETIKTKTRRDIWLVGGGLLARSFLKERLINDVILSTIPVILGEGISLFDTMRQEINFNLVRSSAYGSGIIQNHYLFADTGG